MQRKVIKNGQLHSFILLILYCISFLPSIIPHEHEETHNHNKLSYYEIVTENLDDHTNCSHEQHLRNLKEDCFLCEYCVYNHLFIAQTIESKERSLIGKDYVCEQFIFQEFINYPNKSPPVLI